MLKQELLLNAKGFTLVEIIAVMVILGVLAAVAVPRYVELEDSARDKCLQTLISEINARESLTWADHKISTSGFVSDSKVFNEINYNLDPSYTWQSGDPSISGGIISFKGESFTLSRWASSPLKAALWKLR
jgi:prepilin-type N-terminal cleavage/methylation domain-containing protein